VASFEVPLPLPIATKPDADSGDTKATTKSTAEAPYPAVFIRAPAIMKVRADRELLPSTAWVLILV
jgi:glutamine amidotransferase PdxT